MELHNLKPAKGSVRKNKRVGRGQGSGHGGTSTRGMNGAGSRSGTKDKRGFEGGQMPLQRRVPKLGFKNINRIDYVEFNLGKLQHIADKYNTTTIDFDFLRKNRYVQQNDRVKILGNGEIKNKVTVSAHAVSAKAKSAIEAAGGSVNIIGK
ncbi:MAG: 50S ribosomal protein L15 [Bacteroidetes bacterium]|nr:50S ribosomal protein L15 [Bacteroidota bacterium]